MKKTALILSSLLIFAGISLGAMQEKVAIKTEKISQGAQTAQTLCQRLACIADKLEMSAKVYFWEKNYRAAITFYHLLLKAGKSEFDDLYNLACCYGQTGNSKKAAKYLKLAVDDGFSDLDHIKADPDFEKVKNSPEFEKALEKISVKLDKSSKVLRAQKENFDKVGERIASLRQAVK